MEMKNIFTASLVINVANRRSADDVWCDRGAIEIVVPTSISRLGQDIHPGEIAKFNI